MRSSALASTVGVFIVMGLARATIFRLRGLAQIGILISWPTLIVLAYFSVAAGLVMHSAARAGGNLPAKGTPSSGAEYFRRLRPYFVVWTILWIAYELFPYVAYAFRFPVFWPRSILVWAGGLWAVTLGLLLAPRIQRRDILAAILSVLPILAGFATLFASLLLGGGIVTATKPWGWFQGYMDDFFGPLVIAMRLTFAAAVISFLYVLWWIRRADIAGSERVSPAPASTSWLDWAWMGVCSAALLMPFFLVSPIASALSQVLFFGTQGVLNEATETAFIKIKHPINGKTSAVKFALGDGDQPLRAVGIIDCDTPEYQDALRAARRQRRLTQISSQIADDSNGYRYFLQTSPDPGRVLVQRGIGNDRVDIGCVDLPYGTPPVRGGGCVVLDEEHKFLYVATSRGPGATELHTIKIDVDDSTSPLRLLNTVPLADTNITCGIVDRDRRFLFLIGSNQVSQTVLKFKLLDGNTPPKVVGSALFPRSVGAASFALIDRRGYVYFVSRNLIAQYAGGEDDAPPRKVAECRVGRW